jgi:hypothetical protein
MSADHPYAGYVVQLLDYFEHIGLNETHLCLILDLMWHDVFAFFSGFEDSVVQVALAKTVIIQAVHGLELQSCGVIHNGKCGPS